MIPPEGDGELPPDEELLPDGDGELPPAAGVGDGVPDGVPKMLKPGNTKYFPEKRGLWVPCCHL